MSLEWTPEAIKAEIDYRQHAMLADAEHVRAVRRAAPEHESWWARLARRAGPTPPEGRKVQGNAA
ncbi:hypothetical protein [Umezawaea sp. Da 62-37]|uniref:hypothetical protein n=1 Tax=Umezawaea sp. Da 62-37 TaxID=3075927 RepID=UPI0028F6E094|nr:hypothetical protein [Umezawaea sp. Da 62-37]WNV89622.1 hypothetical protein RM788_15365 [Umezawaea sp. Da 62-37]